jgi:hypothetical protein
MAAMHQSRPLLDRAGPGKLSPYPRLKQARHELAGRSNVSIGSKPEFP